MIHSFVSRSCFVAPADVSEAITVAASDLASKFDGNTSATEMEGVYKWVHEDPIAAPVTRPPQGERPPRRWANTGTCVNIFAPGVDIYGACGGETRCDQVTDSSYTW